MDAAALGGFGGGGVSAVEILKAEVHRMLSVLRSNGRFSSTRRFSREVPLESETPTLRSFKALYRRLQDAGELLAVDAVAYTRPFLDVVVSEDASSVITGVALASVSKFLLYGFLGRDAPRAGEAVNRIARATTHCRFEPSSTADDEVVLMRLLEVIGNALRCGAGAALTDETVWDMAQCCFLISRVEHGSHLLQKTGETTLSHIVMHVFSRADEIADAAEREAAEAAAAAAEAAAATAAFFIIHVYILRPLMYYLLLCRR